MNHYNSGFHNSIFSYIGLFRLIHKQDINTDYIAITIRYCNMQHKFTCDNAERGTLHYDWLIESKDLEIIQRHFDFYQESLLILAIRSLYYLLDHRDFI